MSDDALLAWLSDGAKPALSADEEAARRRNAFSLRFSQALIPVGEIGITEEECEFGIAQDVYAVHMELNAMGEVEYSAVWETLSAPVRRAIKAYIAMARATNA